MQADDQAQGAPVRAGAELHRSPLHDRHLQAGAKFAAFGGWSMPLEYAGAGVLAEHHAVRSAVGLFDVSHLGKVRVAGPAAAAFLNRCLTADLDRIGPGQAQYTLICNDDGGVVDDLIAYLLSPDEVFLIPNAANTAQVVSMLRAVAPAGVEVVDQHTEHAVLAVQGPHSDEVLAGAGLPVGHGYMSFVVVEHAGTPLVVCRTGYTGERGYELVTPSAAAPAVWDAVRAAGEPYGLQPAGLGARDTLRTEMGYPLHGQDLSPAITPLQARLGWAVGWKKPEFFGAAALRAEKEAGPRRLLRGLKAVGRGIPRPGMVVRDADGSPAGLVTSGTFSPTLKTGIALALLDPSVADEDVVTVDVRQRREQFQVTRPPFVVPGVREA
ncbi:MAG: Aminomethyltransferase (glycine cleavage system T protein) [uncultured Friedmanniella sp.]|uniref:Aminomethyltransferase n=1 Tax=uncultured Friedmanniella sp. TaxID=335381 RepID=A0A6J4LFC0_9ACTN|nr:glycine cleavage system aminomethyltransferase GcvT [uncultured Friedmanniella sp.]CAA9329187.1 MAG: Aminomethyltransferase (glycine cleavage system T protein) [uncultured Friedmanniella sp.]